MGREDSVTIKVISEGLAAIVTNVSRLIEDVKVLAATAHYSSAGFLLTTADEEMAKCYILLDACRVDFSRHQNVLKALCRAFYDHVKKHAYIQVIRDSKLFLYQDMDQVQYNWKLEIKKWWPGDTMSGEPDMPHDTYFGREMTLYVDFLAQFQTWSIPNNASDKNEFFDDSFGESKLKKTEATFDTIRETKDIGLFRVDALVEFHESFKKHYLTEKTTTEDVLKVYRDAASRIRDNCGIPVDQFKNSALSEWPLYHFVLQRENGYRAGHS